LGLLLQFCLLVRNLQLVRLRSRSVGSRLCADWQLEHRASLHGGQYSEGDPAMGAERILYVKHL